MLDLTLLVVAALAVWEALEIWNHSSLFARLRARVELWDHLGGDLLRCMFCLTPWVSLVVLTALVWTELHLRVIAWALAVARLANLGNDLTHYLCRTPRLELPNPLLDDDQLTD